MTFTFKRAVRENIALLIGLAGGTGSGKTLSAMKLAKGLSGGKPFVVIDTEAGRAKHYADQFVFDHGDLQAPFRPDAYLEAIQAADKAGYPVIVVDSMSHVWAGDGGCLDWHQEIVQSMVEQKQRFAESKGWKFDEGKTRDQANLTAWNEPKSGPHGHKRMLQRMLQLRAHLILCFRAEEKIEIVKVDGKTEVRKKQSMVGLEGWIPVSEKNLPYELTASFLFTADAPGIPKPIKLQNQMRDLFPLDRTVSEECGAALGEWASGAPEAPKSDYQQLARNAAAMGKEAFTVFWGGLTKAERAIVKPIMGELEKTALSVGAAKDPASFAESVAKEVAEKGATDAAP